MSAIALGIDAGTSGVRGALVDADGGVLAFAGAAIAEGAGRRDPSVWRAALAKMLLELRAGGPLDRVEAVAVDGTSGTVLAIDVAGFPLAPALLYNDTVEDPGIERAIASAAPRESAAHGASSGLARAIALAATPGVGQIVHQADWLAGLLTGRHVSDESNALKTGYDAVARGWPDWIDALPIPRALLPQVVPAGTQTGEVTKEAAQAFALPEGAAVVAGVTDGCAAFLATGADRPGDGVTSLGTTLTIKLLSERPVFAPEYGIYSHRIGDAWLAGGASNTGGGALAMHFGPDDIERLSSAIDPTDETGLDYYPLPRPGERFPIADLALAPRAEPRPADDALFLKGMLEGIARIEALGYRRLAELGAPSLQRLFTVGGGARNSAFTAIRTRVVGVTQAEAASEEAAVGVARLALAHLTAPAS